MTITSGFFRSVGGDRKYTADFFTSYFASFIANGVFPNPSTNLQVLQFQNMQTNVSPGKGWINGHYLINDSNLTIQHPISNGTQPRIDRIVMALNFDNRAMEIYLKVGTPAQIPAAPALTRNVSLYELALADVFIPQGSTQISQSNITDTRLNTQLCGIVHGLVEQVDTTTLYNQYLASFENFTDLKQAEFDAFLADLQDTLDADVAANLLVRIQQIEAVRELSQLNLYDGTKNLDSTWNNSNFWQFSNASNSYLDFVTRQKSTAFQGLSRDIMLEVGNYTIAAYIRVEGTLEYTAVVSTTAVSPYAQFSGISTRNYIDHSDWRLVTFNFTVSQRGYARPRFEPRNVGSGTMYIAGYNLYQGNYTKNWFPSSKDILNQPIPVKSTQAQALAGTDDNTFMTPLRVRDVANTKLNLTGGNLTGNLAIQKGIPELIWTTPNGSYSFSIRKNATDNLDISTDFYNNNVIAMSIINSSNVQFTHPTLGNFSVQDAFDKLQAQATTPTTPIANGKFIGVYE